MKLAGKLRGAAGGPQLLAGRAGLGTIREKHLAGFQNGAGSKVLSNFIAGGSAATSAATVTFDPYNEIKE